MNELYDLQGYRNSSLRVEAVKRDFVAEGSLCRPKVTKSVYGQDAYTAFFMLLINMHVPTVPSNK